MHMRFSVQSCILDNNCQDRKKDGRCQGSDPDDEAKKPEAKKSIKIMCRDRRSKYISDIV